MDSDSCDEETAACKKLVAYAIQLLMGELLGLGVGKVGEQPLLKRQAESFVKDCRNHVWSFNWLCEAVDVDGEAIRKMVIEGRMSELPRTDSHEVLGRYVLPTTLRGDENGSHFIQSEVVSTVYSGSELGDD